MTSKWPYIGIMAVAVSGLLFLIFFKDPFVYWLYGYDASSVNKYSAESFQMFRETAGAKYLVFWVIFGLTFLGLFYCLVALIHRVRLPKFLVEIAFGVTLILCLFYGLIFILTSAMPMQSF